MENKYINNHKVFILVIILIFIGTSISLGQMKYNYVFIDDSIITSLPVCDFDVFKAQENNIMIDLHQISNKILKKHYEVLSIQLLLTICINEDKITLGKINSNIPLNKNLIRKYKVIFDKYGFLKSKTCLILIPINLPARYP